MDHINTLFQSHPVPQKRKHASERGDLMQFFLDHINPGRMRDKFPPLDFPRLGRELKGLELKHLYFIKSRMDDDMRRGIPGGAAFWTALRALKPKDAATGQR